MTGGIYSVRPGEVILPIAVGTCFTKYSPLKIHYFQVIVHTTCKENTNWLIG